MERECLKIVADARRGKNMFALGMLCNIYSLDLQLAREQIVIAFGKKDASVVKSNVKLLEAGYEWAEVNLDFKFRIPATRSTEPQIVVNGNTALALGVLASGMEICATCSRRSAAWCIRPRTRLRPARSRSAPRTPASAPSPSLPAPAIRSSRR